MVKAQSNDEGAKEDGYAIVAIDGKPISPGEIVKTADAQIVMTAKGSLNFAPDKGLQMEPIWMPSPEAVVGRFIEISSEGYQNFTLWEHLGWSLLRVVTGFLFGSLIGIPLGYAMGLSGWFRGWFDPVVEFMRPVPPLALIPLVIIWFGIWETGKIVLLFLAALWIMAIAARSGVSVSIFPKFMQPILLGQVSVKSYATLLFLIRCLKSSLGLVSPWAFAGEPLWRRN